MPRVLRDEQFHADEVGVVFVTQVAMIGTTHISID
jgi:hypothetical protein